MNWLFLALFLFTVALVCFSLLETRNVRIHRIDLVFNTLPAAFDGYEVLHLSDLHINKPNKRTGRLLAALTVEPIDLCVVTGDLIENNEAIPTCLDSLWHLKPQDGKFGVLGNHDYFRYSLLDFLLNRHLTDVRNDSDSLIRRLSQTGFNVLRNESLEIKRNGASIWLVGVDDPVTGKHNVTNALAPVPEKAFTILLTHTPDVLKETRLTGERLILAGHTHGGQVQLPFLGPVKNHSKLKPGFVSGRLTLGKETLVVSNGLGTNRFFPFRFRCRPEVHRIRLKKGTDAV